MIYKILWQLSYITNHFTNFHICSWIASQNSITISRISIFCKFSISKPYHHSFQFCDGLLIFWFTWTLSKTNLNLEINYLPHIWFQKQLNQFLHIRFKNNNKELSQNTQSSISTMLKSKNLKSLVMNSSSKSCECTHFHPTSGVFVNKEISWYVLIGQQ